MQIVGNTIFGIFSLIHYEKIEKWRQHITTGLLMTIKYRSLYRISRNESSKFTLVKAIDAKFAVLTKR